VPGHSNLEFESEVDDPNLETKDEASMSIEARVDVGLFWATA